MAWSPQRSKDTYAPIRSVAYARTHGGFEPPPDPTGRIVYAVCGRRRRIYKFARNDQNGQLSLVAERQPLYGVSSSSVMGDIDGDSSGAWYAEYIFSNINLSVDPDPIFQIPFGPGGSNANTWPFLHRLDADLNLVASYIFLEYSSTFGQYFPWGVNGFAGGGGGNVVCVPNWRQPGQVPALGTPAMVSIGTLLAQPGGLMQNGKTTAKLIGYLNFDPFTATPTSQVAANQQVPNIFALGGKSNTIYGSNASGGGARSIVRWDNGIIVAQKTHADAFNHPTDPGLSDTVEAQAIGGSTGICYTTANNNSIIIRNGALQVTRTHFVQELNAIVGPTPNPSGGVITGFNFVGIGGS